MQTVLPNPSTTRSAAEEAAAVSILTLAFASDPAARWMYPEPERYLTHFPAFICAFAGHAFASGGVHVLPNEAAAALWLPPGVDPDEEAIVALLQRSVPEGQLSDLFAMFDQMGRAHPSVPHWYLPLIGVDPAQQRRGHGSTLIRSMLERCDAEGQIAYLEATSTENLALYERHGFAVTGIIQAGASPTLYPMMRHPH